MSGRTHTCLRALPWLPVMLAGAACAMWGRSYVLEDRFDFQGLPDPAGRQDLVGVMSSRGSLRIVRGSSTRTVSPAATAPDESAVPASPLPHDPAPPRFTWTTRPATGRPRGRSPLAHLLDFRRFREGNVYTLTTPTGTITGHHRQTAVTFPYWCAVLPLLVPPAVSFAIRLRKRARQRAGLCPRCGYDLRATTDTCPECGTPATSDAALLDPPGVTG